MIGCIQKSVLLAVQKRALAEMDAIEKQSPELFVMRNSHVDRTSARTSSTPFAKLRRIPFAALQLDQRHKGCRIEGSVCCKAFRQVATQILLEDVNDGSHAVKVSLYNLLPGSAKLLEVRQLLPEGTKLAIREPYYKVFLDGTSGIRVDNPADVVFLTNTSDASQSSQDDDFDQVKAQGNQAFRLQDYSTAQALYKSCLQQSPANVLILSNLAAVHIELKEFPQALKYAQDGLAIDASHVKCLYRCGVAHTNLEQYNDAIVCFKKARQKSPKDRSIRKSLIDAEELLQQSAGNYNHTNLFLVKPGFTCPQQTLEGRYIALRWPKVILGLAITKTETPRISKCRGLVVTQDVKAGQLLFVHKPLAIAHVDAQEFGFQIDMYTRRMNDRSSADLIVTLASTGIKSSNALGQMYALYDGTKQSLRTMPDISLFSNKISSSPEAQHETDTTRIADIVRFNAFGSGSTESEAAREAQADMLIEMEDPKYKWSALYPLLSMVNHSCCPNSTFDFVKGSVMVRAGQDLTAGDEVTISYIGDIEDAVSQRRHRLLQGWDFLCKCPRCEVEDSLPRSITRLVATITDQMNPEEDKPGRILGLYRKATKKSSQSAFAVPAQELDRLLSELQTALDVADLPCKHQHWVMFSVLEAYLCQRQCYAALHDVSHFQQSATHISALYGSTIPGSRVDMAHMVRNVIYAKHLCPGTSWEDQATSQAQLGFQRRYGLSTKAQTEQALRRAVQQMHGMFGATVRLDD